MKTVSAVLILLVAVAGSQARVLSRCELANELLRFQWAFPRNLLNDWVCLVESESSRNTAARGGPNTDGSFDYGLFQINSMYWCSENGVGNDCNINCYDLLSDDGVGVAVNCVSKIYNQMGFPAWNGWKRACQGQQLPDVGAECGV